MIAVLLTLMLKTLGSIESSTRLKECVVRVGVDKRARHDRNKLDGSEMDDNKVDGGKVNNEVGKKGQKMSKSKKLSKSKSTVGSSDFLTPGTKLVFNKLRQAFFKALILHYLNPERHIQIETDASGYAIGGVLSQLTLDDLG